MSEREVTDLMYRTKDAELSSCGRYRYVLQRTWADPEITEPFKVVCFVMLNPSTADANQDDNTIRKCVKFAKAWGFQRLEVVNLFALRATDPKEMKRHFEPVGPENDNRLIATANMADLVVCAWGKDGGHMGRSREILMKFRERDIQPMALRVSEKTGEPWHPLYLPDDSLPARLQQEKPRE